MAKLAPLCLLSMLALGSLSPAVRAAPGNLDPDFNTGRQLTGTAEEDIALGLALQADGKIIAVGSFGGDIGLSRYRSNGNLESGFTPFRLGDAAHTESAHGVFIEPEGTLLIAGTSVSDTTSALLFKRVQIKKRPAQLSSKLVTVPVGAASPVPAGSFAAIRQTDGMLVSAGYAGAPNKNDFMLARIDTTGATLELDGRFGTGGVVTSELGGDDVAFGMVEQADGKLVAAGRSNASGSDDFALARYNPDGSLDPSFGRGGVVLTDIVGRNDTAEAIALQSDGKLVVAGSTSSVGKNLNVALARYNPDGSLDAGFGRNGLVVTDIGGTRDGAISVLVLPTGRLVVAGYSNAQGDDDFLLLRYRENGALDRTFGSAGAVLTHFGKDEIAYAQALQADGKLVVVGRSNYNDAGDFALARYADVSPPSCSRPTIVGSEGADHLVGTAGPDVIAGLGGNDLIEGLGGDDLLCGGEGDDTLLGGAGNDRLLGEAGDDRLFGQVGKDLLNGGPGTDFAHGGPGRDRCNGERKNQCE